MPPKTTRKRAPKAPDSTPSNTLSYVIELGKEEANPTLSIESTNESPYPLEPLNSDDTKAQTQGNEVGSGVKEEKLFWTKEMLEQLIDTLYEVFKKGGAADNSFKKATFELAAQNVGKVYKRALKVTQQHCKNKWGDLKGK